VWIIPDHVCPISFKDHKIDLEFIERINRWIGETQVKIKAEVAINNQQAHVLNVRIHDYQGNIEALLHPTSEQQVTSYMENELNDHSFRI
jgi:hypothetical protein